MDFPEKRSENRLDIESIRLPFLGTREGDHAPFQYLLLDTSEHGARIGLPQWALGRERLGEGDLINLHMPFRTGQATFDQGRVNWELWDEEADSQVCGIHLEKETPLYYPVLISLAASDISIDLVGFLAEEEVLAKAFKDSILLKKGIIIYLNHLAPYFSRIVRQASEDYAFLKDFLLFDAQAKIKENQEKLEALYEQIKARASDIQEIGALIDLEELRVIMESEIYVDLFRSAFPTEAVRPYLNAIKELEKKLYSNYNTVVMLYLKSFT